MHSWMWWIIVGGVAGILAKAIAPGDKAEPKGCILTILLGIAGAVAMGFLVHTVLGSRHYGGTLGSIVGATIGALILILIARQIERPRG